jgi:leucyl aminopeptidase (aminopeptidase T)
MIKVSKELQNAALLLIRRNIRMKKNERVLVITDRNDCPIFDSICAAVSQLGGKLFVAHITNKREHSSPLPQLKDILKEVDIVIAPTDKSITHTKEVREARKKLGVRVVSMPGITEKIFIDSMATDPKKLEKINSSLKPYLRNAKNITVLSSSGTYFKFKLDKNFRFEFNDTGDCSRKGAVTNIPAGEVYCLFSGGEGDLVIDRWRNEIDSRKQDQKAILRITNGKIIDFTEAASPYVKNQLSAGECGLRIVEFGIGTNPNHKKPIGIVLYDEKVYGTIHFAFGGGGEIRKCNIHEDFVVLEPTIVVDGKEIMKRGKFMI